MALNPDKILDHETGRPLCRDQEPTQTAVGIYRLRRKDKVPYVGASGKNASRNGPSRQAAGIASPRDIPVQILRRWALGRERAKLIFPVGEGALAPPFPLPCPAALRSRVHQGRFAPIRGAVAGIDTLSAAGLRRLSR